MHVNVFHNMPHSFEHITGFVIGGIAQTSQALGTHDVVHLAVAINQVRVALNFCISKKDTTIALLF